MKSGRESWQRFRNRKHLAGNTLRSRWVATIWLGVAKKSSEHIEVIEGKGPAIRCRLAKRRQMSERWQAQKVPEIKATQRRPKPKDTQHQELKTVRDPRVTDLNQSETLEKVQTKVPQTLRRLNFEITRYIAEKQIYIT